MKREIRYLLFFFASLALISCEDSIDLDLGAPNSQIVVDAVIDQTTDTQFIYITRSIAYLDNGNYSGYEMDSVGIIDTSSQVFHVFTHKGNGVYYFVPPAANTFSYGNTYQLLLRDGDDTYFSQSTLHSPVTIDSLTVEYEEDGRFGGAAGNYVTLWARDKPGKSDYYWFRVYRNDSLQAKAGDLTLAIDNAFNEDGPGDGDLFIVPIRENLASRPFVKGEKVQVDVLTITPEMYYYLNLIRTQLNNQGLFAVPPSNVPGNIFCLNDRNKKILGFFGMTGKAASPEIIFP